MTKKRNNNSRNTAHLVSAMMLAVALIVSGCHKDIKDDIKDLQSRLATLEQAVNVLQSASLTGALVKSVTALDNGWKIEVTGGTPASIEVSSQVLSYADNGDGTVTFTLSDGAEFTFRKTSDAAHIELMFLPNEVTYIIEGDYEKITFRVNPSNAYVPVGSGEAIADWALDQISTRATYVNKPEKFELASIVPDDDREGQYIAWIKCKDTSVSYSSSGYLMALVLNTGEALVSSPAFVLGVGWGIPNPVVFIHQTDKVADIQAAIQKIIDDGNYTLAVKGSKTDADAPLVIDMGGAWEIQWQAAYTAKTTGPALKLDGYGKLSINGGSINLTSADAGPALVTENVFLYLDNGGKLRVKGDVLATGDYNAQIYLEYSSEIFIDGDLSLEGEDAYVSSLNNSKLTVTGNLSADKNPFNSQLLNIGRSEVNIGGNLSVRGMALALEGGKASIGGNVSAGGEYAIYCFYGNVFVKGNVSAPNGYGVEIYDKGFVIIDGMVSVADDEHFIYDYNSSAFVAKDAYSPENTQAGYDAYYEYTKGSWYVYVRK